MLKVITPPSAFPVSVEDVHSILRLDLDFTDDDSMIRSFYIPAALDRAEQITHCSLVLKTYEQYFDRFPPSPYQDLKLGRPPLTAVRSVKYLDSGLVQQTWDSSEYYVGVNNVPGIIMPKPGFMYPHAACVPGSVTVQFDAGMSIPGYGDSSLLLRDDIRLAIAQLAAHFYDNPGAITDFSPTLVPGNAFDILESRKVRNA